MSLNLHNPAAGDGLFDILGKFWAVVDALNTAVGTTLPPAAQAAADQFKLLSPSDASYEIAATGLPSSLVSWQGAAAGLAGQVQQNSQNLLREFCRHDADLSTMGLSDAIQYLIADMEAQSAYVTPNALSAGVSVGEHNAGDSALCYSVVRGDGAVQENALGESVMFRVLGLTPSLRPTVTITSDPPSAGLLAYDWPRGSGVSKSITPTDAAASLLSNGNFETIDANELPTGWIVTTGVAGATLWVTTVQEQTITIAGTPAGGYYVVYYTDRQGILWSTPALAWNASGPQLEMALRTIPDLASVTVSTTGTGPNYTHTITMTGTSGNPVIFSSGNFLQASYGYAGPTIVHAISVAGDAYSFKGRALRMNADGLEKTTLYQSLAVTPRQVYFLNAWLTHVGTGAGEIKIEIVNGIGGAVIQDEAGNSLALTLNQSDLATSATPHWFAFRVPPAYARVWVRLRISTPFPAGDVIYVDEMAVSRATELYAGGPFVAMFAGRDRHQYGDSWELTITNTRAGLVQEWFNRIFNAAASEVLLPSAGDNLIPNSVVAGAVS